MFMIRGKEAEILVQPLKLIGEEKQMAEVVTNNCNQCVLSNSIQYWVKFQFIEVDWTYEFLSLKYEDI